MTALILKPRFEPVELQLRRILNLRMNLSEDEIKNYHNLEKGFKGEQKWDLLLENLKGEWQVLNDLWLEFHNTTSQVDSLLISEKTIFLLNIKYFEGDFDIEGGKWYYLPGKEIQNPLLQLERSESILRRLLLELGYKWPIESYIIFVNPEFHLYRAPRNPHLIFPSQINRFLKKLSISSSKLTDRHLHLAEKLIALNKPESPYKRLPEYKYEQLEKGITCCFCRSFKVEVLVRDLVCCDCGCKEGFAAAVLRSVAEFKLFFPDRKITTKGIYEWCKVVPSKKAIRRVLMSEYELVGRGKSSNFVVKN